MEAVALTPHLHASTDQHQLLYEPVLLIMPFAVEGQAEQI